MVEEMLYPAMEDYQLDLILGQGPSARTIKITLPPFTLIGATTRAGLLTSPLRERFGVVPRVEFYAEAELSQIVKRSAGLLDVPISDDGALEISRKVPGNSKSGQPSSPEGPGLCAGRGSGRDYDRTWPKGPWTCSAWTTGVWTKWTGTSCSPLSRNSAGGRSGWTPCPR